MAEVQRRLEAFTVEVEELTQVGFFSDEECKCVVKKLFEFENKINSMNKNVQDFKEYISYVISLYRMIKLRRNKIKIGDKKHHLEYRVLQRAKNLYEMAVVRFPREVDLFFTFFQFCKESNFQHASQSICQTMLKYHRNNELVWLTAARLKFHEKKDPIDAIKLLQQGIGIHKTSADLYLECIQYEIVTEINENQEDSEEEEEIPRDQLVTKVNVYLNEAKKHISDYKFFTNLLTFLKRYKFTESIQIDLVKHLVDKFHDFANVWNYLARRELAGTHFDIDACEISRVALNKAFMNSIQVYEKGLNVISHENSQDLWNFYLDCLVNFKNKECDYSRLVISAFEKASSLDFLDEKFYFLWLDLVDAGRKRELLKTATDKMPLSVDLWSLRMRIELATCEHVEVDKTFQDGCKALTKNALPLWEQMLQYMLQNVNKDEMNAFYLKALHEPCTIASYFKPKYLQWLAMNESIAKCRETYKCLVNEKPFCKEMYVVMRDLELEQVNIDEERLELLHNNACKQFGSENIDVWIDFIKFLLSFKTIREAKNKTPQIVIEAKKLLNEHLVDAFQVEYDKVMNQDLDVPNQKK